MRSLRTLLILIGRQFADDAAYLVVIFVVAACCLLALALLAFIYPHGLVLPEVFIFGILPVVTSTSLFAFGLAQTCGDRTSLAFLSVLSPHPPILLARLVIGVIFTGVVIVVLVIAITGGIAGGLVRWPVSFSASERVDLFMGLFGIGLACYCLGLMAAQKGRSFSAGLRAWPLVLTVTSLIVAKGLGYPLNIFVVYLIAVLLLYLLIVVRHPRLAAVPALVVVSVLTIVPLYWLRYSLDVATTRAALAASDEASLTCHYEFPLKRGSDHYWESDFLVTGEIRSYYDFPFLERTGIASYLRAKKSVGDSINRWWQGRWSLRYDAPKGCFVRYTDANTVYAGSEAVAETPTESLGRFVSPVVCYALPDEAVVFDQGDSRLYILDFGQRRLRRGRDVVPDTFHHVVAVTSMPDLGDCFVHGHYASARDEDVLYESDSRGIYVPLFDESGAIAVLDLRTGDLIVGAGHLPAPHSPFGRASPRLRDLFACDTEVIVKRPENEYAGLITGTLSRQGASVTVAVFEEDGRFIREDCSAVPVRPWLTTKYLVESLHPPVLALASLFTAYSFDAGATHRALFLMPNSFVAQQRDRQTNFLVQLLWALLFMLPGVVFAGFLSWRVVVDAKAFGLSGWSRLMWMIATLAFGLPAYITYRLMRPKCVLAICRECGRGRRVDRDVCHHCGRGWESPELEPPAWRVISDHNVGRTVATQAQ